MNKVIKVAMLFLVLLMFAGCWNYRGLSELDIVCGISLDLNEESEAYSVCFEILDLSSDQSGGDAKSVLLESHGKTIFEAISHARQMLGNQLYLGNLQIVIISKSIAEKEGIAHIVDSFMRNGELRETINLVISGEDTAFKLLEVPGIEYKIKSFEINKIVKEYLRSTKTARESQLYLIYDRLFREGKSLVLPYIKALSDNNKKTSELVGLAVFNYDKVVTYLTVDEGRNMLLASSNTSKVTLSMEFEGEDKLDLLIGVIRSSPKISFKNENGKLHFTIDIDLSATVTEITKTGMINIDFIRELEKRLTNRLKEDIETLVNKTKKDYGLDILGMGDYINKHAYKLWKDIGDSWMDHYKEATFDVNPKVKIINTYLTK